jgi:hypothetical protein
MLRRYSLPAPLYLTTYYSAHSDWAVFNPTLPYILWKARGTTLCWPEVFGQEIVLDDAGRKSGYRCGAISLPIKPLSGRQKNDLLLELSGRTNFDLVQARKKRIIYLMSNEEVRQAASEGLEVQLDASSPCVWGG